MDVMVEFDPEVAATYVRLRDDTVARTVELMDAYCSVDLNATDKVLGLEILEAPADIPEAVFQVPASLRRRLGLHANGLGHQSA